MIKPILFAYFSLFFFQISRSQIVELATLPDGWHKAQIQPGVYYDGETIEGRLEGKGIMIWSDSSSYSGKWKNNMRHGKGTMKWKNGNIYMGSFKNDEMTKGTFVFTNGNRYYGSFEDDKFHGKGKIFKTDGSVEKGVWKYGKRVE